MASWPLVSALMFGLVLIAVPTTRGQSVKANVPYSDAKPVFDVLREDLLPAELRGRTPAEIEALWPDWVSRRDAMIRAMPEIRDRIEPRDAERQCQPRWRRDGV